MNYEQSDGNPISFLIMALINGYTQKFVTSHTPRASRRCMMNKKQSIRLFLPIHTHTYVYHLPCKVQLRVSMLSKIFGKFSSCDMTNQSFLGQSPWLSPLLFVYTLHVQQRLHMTCLPSSPASSTFIQRGKSDAHAHHFAWP